MTLATTCHSRDSDPHLAQVRPCRAVGFVGSLFQNLACGPVGGVDQNSLLFGQIVLCGLEGWTFLCPSMSLGQGAVSTFGLFIQDV